MCICDKVDALHFILSRKSRMRALGASHLAYIHEICKDLLPLCELPWHFVGSAL